MFCRYPVFEMAAIVVTRQADQKYYLSFAILRQCFAFFVGLARGLIALR